MGMCSLQCSAIDFVQMTDTYTILSWNFLCSTSPYGKSRFTVGILSIGTYRSKQTVQTQIRLLQKEQSDLGLHCLPFHQLPLDALLHCKTKMFKLYNNYGNIFHCPNFYNFYGSYLQNASYRCNNE